MTGLLEVQGVTKRYGRLVALENVSASFRPGEIHGVLGENGAGKSTLVSIVAGFVRPDEGRIELDGVPLELGRPFAARHRGIEMVHQHFALVPAFDAAENVALYRLDRLTGGANIAARTQAALALAARLGWEIPAQWPVREMSVGVQQRLEILKAMSGDAQVLIFDEPTAVLGPEEVQDLFAVLRKLRDEGRTVVLIAHKLAEIMAITDRVTVLRKGVKVLEAATFEIEPEQLAHAMVGEIPAGVTIQEAVDPLPGLTLRNVTVQGDRGERAVNGVTLDVPGGRIIGVGGVDGNGQRELAEFVAGVRPAEAGEATFAGAPVDLDAVRVAYIPQDRRHDGLALDLDLVDNLLLGGFRRPELRRGFWLRATAVRAWCRDLVERFSIKTDSLARPVKSLSGGNQQKVIVSRNLDRRPDLLVAVNPTRGLDVRATDFVHDQIRQARAQGTAVLLVSTDLDELISLSDTTYFLSRGRLTEATSASAYLGGLPA